MQEVFEKIKEKIGDEALEHAITGQQLDQDGYYSEAEKEYIQKDSLSRAIDIVNQVTEEYNDGWISIDERFPENDNYILMSFANFSLPQIGRYEEDSEGGAFYLGDELETCISHDLIVNAWQPLPGSYQPKGE